MAKVVKQYFSTKADRSKFYRYLNILSKKFVFDEDIFCIDKDKFLFTDGSFYITMQDTKLNINSKSEDILALNNTHDFKTGLENDTNIDNIQEFIDKHSYEDYLLSQKVKDVRDDLVYNYPDKGKAYLVLFMDSNTIEELSDIIDNSDKFISAYSTFVFNDKDIELESIYSKSKIELSNVKIDYLTDCKNDIKLSLPMPIYNILDKVTCLDCALYRHSDKNDLVDLDIEIDNIVMNIKYRILKNKDI